MRSTWLIEAGVYGDEADPLLAEARRQGMVGDLISHQALAKGARPSVQGQTLAPGVRVIAYGTYPFARQIQLHHTWVPGAWCNAENLDCSTYYPHFGKYLLNQQNVILPGVEAIRRRDELFATFAHEDEVFARPSSCQKVFVGRLVDRDSFAHALAPTRYDPSTLVVIAPPRTITCEWRLVVIHKQVIAASQYALDGVREVSPGCPESVRQFAERMLVEVGWQPDPIFMMDIGESEGRLWLVELNSFSCSWLYQCDLPEVVARASELGSQSPSG